MVFTKKNSFVFSAIIILITLVVGFYFIGVNYQKQESLTRSVTIEKSAVDSQDFLESFDNAQIITEGKLTSFTGVQKVDVNILDYVSSVVESEYETPQEQTSIKYFATYDEDTNIVTLSATITTSESSEELDEIYGLAFIGSEGEVDAIMNIEGESILLSELAQLGMIENCGWLSRLIKKAVAAVVAVVVVVAAPIVAAVVIVAVVAYEVTEKVSAASNYAYNSKNVDPNAYINNQNNGGYGKWKFGLSTMDKNGCGVMAVYNILRLRNANKNLANIAYDVESRNGTIALGFFGTDPTHFGEYFRGQGISATAYTNLTTLENAAKEMSSSQQIIFTAWNDTSIFKGAHVVCVEKKANSINYSVYNATGYGYGASTYSSLASYIGNGSLMIGYIVG